ncbi:MAG: decaprenyl-phosphate phosphoribosyltransferase [Anaerolineae bacterium]
MFKALFKTMRPKQWAKNVFIFAALVFDRKLTNTEAILHTVAGAILFSLLASAVYIINDINDVEADRHHPLKRYRPIAAGTLPIPLAWLFAGLLLVVCLPLAYWLSPAFAGISLFYFLLNLAYSRWIKHIVLMDIIVLASFYVIRVAAGVTLIQVQRFSPWIYIFTVFLSLLIGTGKRRAELSELVGLTNNQRRVLDGYTLNFLDQIISLASAVTIVTYSLYTFSAVNLPENHAMMLTIPFILYGVMRYQYLLQVINRGGAPEEVILSDRPLQLTIAFWSLAVLLIFYLS